MDREIGIPDDHIVHDDFIYAAGSVPFMWHRQRWAQVIKEVHDRGITGEGVTIGIHDTGSPLQHDLLDMSLVARRRNYTGSPDGDSNRHGGHCHGIIAGLEGIGLAPGATIHVYKVLGDNGSGRTDWINDALVQSAKDGCDLASRSLGSPPGTEHPQDQRAVDDAYANGLSLDVSAAGNAGYNGSRNTIGPPGSLKNVWTVGATRQNDQIANFSSGGPTIDSAAPGENIISIDSRSAGGTISMSGTSMATPNVAGAKALIIQKRRRLGFADLVGVEQWREFYVDNGLMIDGGRPGFDHQFGIGIAHLQNIFRYLLDQEPEWVLR